MKVNIHTNGPLPRYLKQQIRAETKRALIEQRELLDADFDAVILWYMHVSYGFGRERLRAFFDGFVEAYNEMVLYYCGADADGKPIHDDTACFAAREKLMEIGVDVLAWDREIAVKRKQKKEREDERKNQQP